MNAFIDFVVQQIYAEARFDPSRATPTPELVRALVGSNAIHRVQTKRGIEKCASSCAADGGLVIHVPATIAPWQINHRVSRQLAKWYLMRHGYDGGQVDTVVRSVAAAVCMPTPAFARAREKLGENISELSAHFRVSQSLAALRVAECVGYPTALRTANQIIVRGNYWDWPSSDAEWTTLFRRARASGFVVQYLSDVRGRVVLRAH